MAQTATPLLGFIGHSNSGKTTLVTALINRLTKFGLRIGAVKHHRHRFEIDREGKDSWRFARAGAQKTLLAGPSQTALIEQTAAERPLTELAAEYLSGLDLVLVEGFKLAAIPKIELWRPELGQPLLTRGESFDPALVAFVSTWQPGTPPPPRCPDFPEIGVPLFAPDEIGPLTEFICRRFALRPEKR